MIDTVIDKKAVMYAIIKSLESDFVDLFSLHLVFDDIPAVLLERSNRVENETNIIRSYLMGLDIQAFVEICNANVDKLGINIQQKRFLNNELVKIIPIRNKVMHPRPIEITDLPVLDTVARELPEQLCVFEWPQLKHTFYQIDNDPSSIQLPPIMNKKSEKIIENLPIVVDYEDTSFIGRRQEIGELKAKLNKRNVHVLSVIGDGGVGKTAIVLKLLYDMLDDDACKFELILWVSLKTNQLSGYEFKRINDAIESTSLMYEKLGEFVGRAGHSDIPSYLIELSEEFETLLVLDNLETVNSEDIKLFIDKFTEHGKVLITSRIGLGEMEHRYRLDGLNEQDVFEYTNTLLSLYGFEGLLSNDQILHITQTHLHSNPLAIKWFVKGLYSGLSVEEILANKNKLINFCMSNVYDKLSQRARTVLEIIQILKIDISVGELMFYSNSSAEEYTEISLAINELIKCNFLDSTKFRTKKLLSITSFASEFLQYEIIPDRDKGLLIRNKGKILAAHKQRLEQKKIENPSGTDTFFFYGDDSDKVVATYFLSEAIKNARRRAPIDEILQTAKIAQVIAPDYAECAAVVGHCYSTSSIDKADNEYKRAISYCKNDDEKAAIFCRYARFLRTNQLYQDAIGYFEKAYQLKPDDIAIKFELIMSLCWVSKFDRAKEELDNIDVEQLTPQQKHEFTIRYADMLRREADVIGAKDAVGAFSALIKAFEMIESDEICDNHTRDVIASILCAISYLPLNDEMIDYIICKLDVYYPQIRNSQKYKKFRESMVNRISVVESGKREHLIKYLLDADALLSKIGNKQGIVVERKKKYGFMRVNGYGQSIYFSINEGDESINVGDVVTYEKIVSGSGGLIGLKLKKYSVAQKLVEETE